MFSRSKSDSGSHKGASRLRRPKSCVSTLTTSSDMLRPDQKNQQAITAAQRAFEGDRNRRNRDERLQQTNTIRQGLSERDINRTPLDPRLNFRRSPEKTTVEQDLKKKQFTDDACSSVSSPAVHSSCSRYELNGDSTSDFDSSTVIRRKSLQWEKENSPTRFNRPSRIDENFEIEYSTDGYSPRRLPGSTPSSYRRLSRSKSEFSLAHVFPPQDQDISCVAYSSERSPQKNNRKSMSFLRGGTEFMPESMRTRELYETKGTHRKSFYIPSSSRQSQPMILPDSIRDYKGKNEKGEWGAIRVSVKKRARKLSESVFCSVKSMFGKTQNSKDQKTTAPSQIPEQHVSSSRMHFRDYVTQEELYEGFPTVSNVPGTTDKPKIRSNYVISRAPTLQFVPSNEMLRSELGSIGNITPPPVSTEERKVSGRSMDTFNTATSTNWNSSLISRKTDRTFRNGGFGSINEAFGSISAQGASDGEYFVPPPRRKKYNNVDVRKLYSALVKKLDDDPPKLKPMEGRQGYYMTPGIGLLPEEEGIFERNSTPEIEKQATNKLFTRKVSKENIDIQRPGWEVPEEEPPPVPEIPKIWLDAKVNQITENSTNASKPFIELESRDEIKKYDQAMPMTPAMSSSADNLSRMSVPRTRKHDITVTPKQATDVVASALDLTYSTDAALSACHRQVLKKRRSTPVYVKEKEEIFTSPASSSHIQSLCTSEGPLSNMDSNIPRSKSVLDYRAFNSESPIPRTKTAVGFDNAANRVRVRAGLRPRDLNVQANYKVDHPLMKRESRMSISGRISRASTREFDLGLAVKEQFGPIAGDEYPAFV